MIDIKPNNNLLKVWKFLGIFVASASVKIDVNKFFNVKTGIEPSR
jgi:hypothetical protein